ncbi:MULTISPECIES: hypothetical protein [unclassified Nocardia]|uniref:hypothetical protein n=1 Tax=unclassified Nocardia TaxID=2637762 RepID=UPI00278C5E30|nr:MULTISPECIES: hypothetical protein [unclassified Nocardia]
MKRLLTLEPAVVRSILVGISAVVAVAVNRQIDTTWVDTITQLYVLGAPILAGILIRPAVTPNARATEAARATVSFNVSTASPASAARAVDRLTKRHRSAAEYGRTSARRDEGEL